MSDDSPLYEKFLSLIRDRTRDNNRLGQVLKVFETEITPEIRAMPQEQLAEAFSECLYALYCELEINLSKEGNIEHFETEVGIFKEATGHLEGRLDAAPAQARRENSKHATDVQHADLRKKTMNVWQKFDLYGQVANTEPVRAAQKKNIPLVVLGRIKRRVKH